MANFIKKWSSCGVDILSEAQKKAFALGQAVDSRAGIFGGMVDVNEAGLVILPVPWEGTASYGGGSALAPLGVLTASHQLDLEDPWFGRAYGLAPAFAQASEELLDLNRHAQLRQTKDWINKASCKVDTWVETQASKWFELGKAVAVIGGEHSVSYGLLKSLSNQLPSFSILHIDAHFDLRCAYEGYERSHASIMYNVLENLPQVDKIVHVGIRDFSAEELCRSHASKFGLHTIVISFDY